MADVLVDWVKLIYSVWSTPTSQRITALIGTTVVAFSAVQTIRMVWFWVKPSSLQAYCHSKTGSWALVTGASDGIGRGFAEELLENGFNVLLHGRNPDKLQKIQLELAKAHPRRTVDIVVADASKYDDSYKNVTERVNALPGKLVIVVNNVGGISTKPQYCAHAETPHDSIDTVLNLNARFPLHVTRDLLPVLHANTPSLLLNCGSAGALLGTPYITTYIGTKALIHQFTAALKTELVAEGMQGIEVLGVFIGNVKSAGNSFERFGGLNSRQCAAACLSRVGCGSTLTYAYWFDALQGGFASLMPERMINKFLIDEMGKRNELDKKSLERPVKRD